MKERPRRRNSQKAAVDSPICQAPWERNHSRCPPPHTESYRFCSGVQAEPRWSLQGPHRQSAQSSAGQTTNLHNSYLRLKQQQTLMFGHFSFSLRAMPVMVPPVPAPATSMSILPVRRSTGEFCDRLYSSGAFTAPVVPSHCSRISSAVES